MLSVKKVLAKLLNNTIRTGTWTPHIYDFATYKTALTSQPYWKIGKLYILRIYTMQMPNITFNTMMQIRNIPCKWILGGQIYIANVTGQGGDRTIQSSDVGVYPRPNITGAINGGVFSALLIGADL